MGKQRIHYWDNAKAALILLVVMGHFLLPLENKMGGGYRLPTGGYIFSTCQRLCSCQEFFQYAM